MLRYTARATLSKIKLKNVIMPLPICRHSTDKSSRKEMADEAASEKLEEIDYPKREDSERLSEFRKKLKEDITAAEMNRYNLMTPKENDPLPPWPNNVNPHTGEIGGPRGPEPTRYGDWERKGICVDF